MEQRRSKRRRAVAAVAATTDESTHDDESDEEGAAVIPPKMASSKRVKTDKLVKDDEDDVVNVVENKEKDGNLVSSREGRLEDAETATSDGSAVHMGKAIEQERATSSLDPPAEGLLYSIQVI